VLQPSIYQEMLCIQAHFMHLIETYLQLPQPGIMEDQITENVINNEFNRTTIKCTSLLWKKKIN